MRDSGCNVRSWRFIGGRSIALGISASNPHDRPSGQAAPGAISSLLSRRPCPQQPAALNEIGYCRPPCDLRNWLSADIVQAVVNGCLLVQSGRERLTWCWCFLGTNTKLTKYPDSSQRLQRSAPTAWSARCLNESSVEIGFCRGG